ncbi:hypothetical protein I5Q34_30935 [Streptomyces sp. AV19]|uniref:hypothetical protein n=1 Tax=Streptomyces sp. AV19 TaxID=2793068 RepID=UPI0018FED923|nr:hypothetical protein [Streptomyces sp. AV19]MBH1938624.1 hypothetical protein [Streptomyces sp. AV19]MDG4535268.1 hypothetical protein [Streptomyces sp. AV19]
MGTQATPQLAPAMALVRLITAHPDLPRTRWSVDDGILHGHVYGPEADNFTAIRTYASALGGSVRPGVAYEYNGERLRSYRVTALRPGVRVEVAVSVPAALYDPDLVDPPLPGQRHDVSDPAVPVEQQAVAK